MMVAPRSPALTAEKMLEAMRLLDGLTGVTLAKKELTELMRHLTDREATIAAQRNESAASERDRDYWKATAFREQGVRTRNEKELRDLIDGFNWMGCYTGDCPHEYADQCNAPMIAVKNEFVAELYRVLALSPPTDPQTKEPTDGE